MCLDIRPFGSWERNAWLSDGRLELVVTLEVGPRVIRLAHPGGENLLHVDERTLGGRGEETWQMRGGHRLWIAPESAELSYEPDNEPVDFEAVAGGICVATPPGPVSRIKKRLTVMLPGDATARLRHEIVNHGSSTVSLAPWAVTAFRPGGRVIVPLPGPDPKANRFVPTHRWVFWPYTNIADPRLVRTDAYLQIAADPTVRPAFKMGIDHREGWVAYANGGICFWKAFRPGSGDYPDGGVSLEVFLGRRAAELETLGAIAALEPGDRAVHDEFWALDAPLELNERDAYERLVEPAGRRLSEKLGAGGRSELAGG